MRILKPVAAMSLFASTVGLTAYAGTADDPLLRPIAPAYSARWLTPQKPVHVFGNAYLVGFGGLTVALIRTKAGLVLIDGAVPQAVKEIEANIAALGFSIRDVKYILSTEPHYDHAGGIAALARDSGATVIASEAAAKVLKAGGRDPDDAQASILETLPAPARIRAVRNGEAIALGDVRIVALATPGHTDGSMSWTWNSCEGKRCARILFSSSLSTASADDYRFTDHPYKIANFRRSFAKVRALKCDILFTAHPDQGGNDVQYAAFAKGAKPNPFLDPKACGAYADRFAARLDDRLKKEAAPR